MELDILRQSFSSLPFSICHLIAYLTNHFQANKSKENIFRNLNLQSTGMGGLLFHLKGNAIVKFYTLIVCFKVDQDLSHKRLVERN